MSHDDADIFLKAVQDVTPLPAGEKRILPARKPAPTLANIARQQAASAQPSHCDDNPLSLPDDLALCDPHDIAGLRKNGVQEGVYRKLRLGQYPPQDSLDLHRLTLKDARTQVHQFLQYAQQQGLRTLLITHGKGATGLMKSYCWHWLTEHPLVLAWHSAPQRQGGAGATLVLIRTGKKHEQHT